MYRVYDTRPPASFLRSVTSEPTSVANAGLFCYTSPGFCHNTSVADGPLDRGLLVYDTVQSGRNILPPSSRGKELMVESVTRGACKLL